MLKGAHILKHPALSKINTMFKQGKTSKEIEQWLKQTYTIKNLHRTKYELGAYRNNYLEKMEK